MLGMAVCVAVLLDAPFAAAILVLELSGSTEVGAASLFAASSPAWPCAGSRRLPRRKPARRCAGAERILSYRPARR